VLLPGAVLNPLGAPRKSTGAADGSKRNAESYPHSRMLPRHFLDRARGHVRPQRQRENLATGPPGYRKISALRAAILERRLQLQGRRVVHAGEDAVAGPMRRPGAPAPRPRT
jgi:hypothetical protein